MVWWCKRFFTFQSIISIIFFSIIIFDQVYAVFYIERKKKSAEHIFCILYFTNVPHWMPKNWATNSNDSTVYQAICMQM